MEQSDIREILFHALAALGIAITISLAACSGPDPEDPRFKATEGQALQDLHKARQQGAISGDEYDDFKDEIYDRYED